MLYLTFAICFVSYSSDWLNDLGQFQDLIMHFFRPGISHTKGRGTLVDTRHNKTVAAKQTFWQLKPAKTSVSETIPTRSLFYRFLIVIKL